MVAPTQDLRLNKVAAIVLEEEENEDQKEQEMDESTSEQKEEWKSLRQKRKEIKRAPNKQVYQLP